jgi:8-oxo-dGTP pyrophosphatase MutT (NUDIX family)
MLDNFVAGGQPVGIGLMENVIKEAKEEAGVPPEIARRARPIGLVSYCQETPEGLKPDVLFDYDLELPPDFVPRNHDGEIAEFYLWPAEQVMEVTAETRDFKFNCNLVNIDFFVRHGLIPPDHPDYVDIVRGLHR